MQIPIDVLNIIKKLNKNGFEAYTVGGCVRDYILRNEPKDWDITTSALPLEVKALFPHTYDTGIKHGTITIVCNKTNYEVTTYRIDGNYKDNRHPDEVTFTKNITEDLSRRDFTMNAIAYHEENGFVDPFGGINDIKNKLIRGVGNPILRFEEDALRIMRAIRFSAQLDFDIENETFKALTEKAELIKNISMERIRDELIKLLLSPNPEKAKLLYDTQIFKFTLPILDEKYTKFKTQILKTLKAFKYNEIKNTSLFMSALLTGCSESEAKVIMKNLKFDTKTLKETCFLTAEMPNIKEKLSQDALEDYCIRKYIFKPGEDLFKNLLEFTKAVAIAEKNEILSNNTEKTKKRFLEIIKNKDCCSLKSLAINGEDIKKTETASGKDIGILLNSALNFVLQNPENNKKEILMNFVKNYKKTTEQSL